MSSKPKIRKPQHLNLTFLRVFALAVMAVGLPLMSLAATQAADISGNLPKVYASSICPESTSNPGNNNCALPEVKASSDTLKNIIQIGLGIIGAFAFLNMVGSGFKYITSAGDPQKTSEAKKGVIFALVGLAIAIAAEAIVAFVIHRGTPS